MQGQGIYKAIPQIIAEMQAIPKDQESGTCRSGFSFAFRGIDGIKDTLSPLFGRHGVFVVPEVIDEEYRTTQTGKPLNHAVLTVQFTFYANDGSSIVSTTKGEGMDFGDKAYAKAHTMALKTCLDEVFCIKTHDKLDNEYDNIESTRDEATEQTQPEEPEPEPEPTNGNGKRQIKMKLEEAVEILKTNLGGQLQEVVEELVDNDSDLADNLKRIDLSLWSREALQKLWALARATGRM